MPLPPFLKNIFAGGAGELIKNIGDAADKIFTSKEEKEQFKQDMIKEVNRNMERMTELSTQEAEVYLKDVQSARETNARVQESEKASWLAKNIAYIIDIFVMAIWGFLTIYLMCTMLHIIRKMEGVDYTAVTAIWGAVGTYASTVLQFHRGTSRGSEDKQKQLTQMMGSSK